MIYKNIHSDNTSSSLEFESYLEYLQSLSYIFHANNNDKEEGEREVQKITKMTVKE